MMSQQSTLRAGRSLLILAALVALYLTAMVFGRESVPGCGEAGGCDSVTQSQWSHIFGLPVSCFAILTYVLGVALSRDYAGGASNARIQVLVAQLVYGMILLAAGWFASLLIFKLHTACLLCILTHALAVGGVALLFLARRAAYMEPAAMACEEPDGWARFPWRRRAFLCGGLALGGVFLVVGPEVGNIPVAKISAAEQEIVTAPSVAHDRLLRLHDGKFTMNLDELPRMGDPSAPQMCVVLTDFSCEFCRKFYPVLEEAVKKSEGQLCLYLLPAALDDNAEQIQVTMQVVYRSNPANYEELCRELISGELAPLPRDVTNRAEYLMGAESFREAMTRHGIGARYHVEIAKGVLKANKAITESMRLPQVLSGKLVLVGYYDDPRRVLDFIQESIGPRPQLPMVPVPAPVNADVLVQQGEGAQPPLLLTEPGVSLGSQVCGTYVRVPIKVKNPRPVSLSLGWFEMDAGCQLDGAADFDIAPQQEVSLAVLCQVPATVGPFKKVIRIHDTQGISISEIDISGTAGGESAQASSTANTETDSVAR